MRKVSRPVLCWVLWVLAGAVAANEPVQVVASFSIIGDMVRTVGGEQVSVRVLVGADEDAHVYKPSPLEVREVQAADLVVLNGLGFEGWLPRLLEASGYQGATLVASQGIVTEHQGDDAPADDHGHDHGDTEAIDPHAWHNIEYARQYIRNIAASLSELVPDAAGTFAAREQQLLTQLNQLDQRMREGLSRIPPEDRIIISAHSGFRYLTEAYGIRVLSPVGTSTGAGASARDIAELVRFMKTNRVQAVFAENITNNRLITQVARETGIPVFGQLYSDALSGPDGPAATYLDMMTYNFDQLLEALVP